MDFLHIFIPFREACGLEADRPPGGAKERLVLEEAGANWPT